MGFGCVSQADPLLQGVHPILSSIIADPNNKAALRSSDTLHVNILLALLLFVAFAMNGRWLSHLIKCFDDLVDILDRLSPPVPHPLALEELGDIVVG